MHKHKECLISYIFNSAHFQNEKKSFIPHLFAFEHVYVFYIQGIYVAFRKKLFNFQGMLLLKT